MATFDDYFSCLDSFEPIMATKVQPKEEPKEPEPKEPKRKKLAPDSKEEPKQRTTAAKISRKRKQETKPVETVPEEPPAATVETAGEQEDIDMLPLSHLDKGVFNTMFAMYNFICMQKKRNGT